MFYLLGFMPGSRKAKMNENTDCPPLPTPNVAILRLMQIAVLLNGRDNKRDRFKQW